MSPDIAMAASARDWPDRLHRFLLDHGGGRVVERVMSADQATAGEFDVLLIDDVCSFLSPRLISLIKQSGGEVIGIYLPEDGSDAKRRLLECGISDVLEAEATPEEFLGKIRGALAHRVTPPPPDEPTGSRAFRIGVTAPCEGVGATEVSIALSHSLARSLSSVLLDLDPAWPSIAQRLDLPPHPNIRTAIDHTLHRPDRLGEAFHEINGLLVIGGRADGGQGAEISRGDALMLLDAVAATKDVLVCDLGPMGDLSSMLAREFDTLMVVGAATPVGIARLIRTVETLQARNPAMSLVVVINKVGRGGFRRSELVGETGRALPDVPVMTLPFDLSLQDAAWNGTPPGRGRFTRSVQEVSSLLVRTLD